MLPSAFYLRLLRTYLALPLTSDYYHRHHHHLVTYNNASFFCLLPLPVTWLCLLPGVASYL
jgi:hypothetical protein